MKVRIFFISLIMTLLLALVFTACDNGSISSTSTHTHIPGAGATCTTAEVCTSCGEVLEAALGHKTHNRVEATCTAPGNEGSGECIRCGEEVEGLEIPINPDAHYAGCPHDEHPGPGFAPESLVRGYIFTKQPKSTSVSDVDYWIWTSFMGFSPINSDHLGKRMATSYTYTKTGPNTATFTYREQQNYWEYVNGPIYSRWILTTGTLTYSSAEECVYVYSYTSSYIGSGSGIKRTYYPFIDPSKVYLPD